MKAKILILLLLLSGVAQAITPWEKRSITQAIGQGAWETSEQLFRKLKETQLPAEQAAQVDYNLGLSLYHQEKYGDALPLFESAAKSSDEVLKAKALYNQGNSLFKMEKLDEAKAAYEKAFTAIFDANITSDSFTNKLTLLNSKSSETGVTASASFSKAFDIDTNILGANSKFRINGHQHTMTDGTVAGLVTVINAQKATTGIEAEANGNNVTLKGENVLP